MKVLVFNKDYPSLPTGYAKCSREIWVKRISILQKFSIALYVTIPPSLETQSSYNGVQVFFGRDLNGEFDLPQIYRLFKPNIYVTQIDPWILENTTSYCKNHIKWVAYVPIDFFPVPNQIYEKLRPASAIVTQSRWATKVLRKKLHNVVGHIYPGVDFSIYKPEEESKEQIKQTNVSFMKNLKLGLNDFIITINQRNQFRKTWPEQLLGIKYFSEANPDIKAKVYLHTYPSWPGELELNNLVKQYKLKNISIFCDPDSYLNHKYTEEYLSKIYNISDVNLLTSLEGFGLPTIEALACGTPTIGLDMGVTKELLAPITPELLVETAKWITRKENLQMPLPDAESIAKKLKLVANKGSNFYFKKVNKYAKKFSWDSTAQKFAELLENVQ